MGRDPKAVDPIETALAYHERTKHHLHRYARSAGYLDWATQPDPFRRYDGAESLLLDEVPPGPSPGFADVLVPSRIEPRRLDRSAVSQLFYDSMAISAWKQLGPSRWSLRVNPSSGALHPTEAYLLTGPVPGLLERPGILHYSPFWHAIELRAELEPGEWEAIAGGLPRGAALVALTSIHWRESWKYGERAFRYCNHDVGHAIAAIALAAAAMGWETRLLDGPADDDLGTLLGTRFQRGPEAEHPDALLAVFPRGAPWGAGSWTLSPEVLARLRPERFSGDPNVLSPDHLDWPVIDEVSVATRRPASPAPCIGTAGTPAARAEDGEDDPWRAVSAREIVRRRRSAVAMDGRTGLDRPAFARILRALVPSAGRVPWSTLPWEPAVHPVLFVHRVRGIEPGLYALARAPGAVERLRGALREDLEWRPVPGLPDGVELFRLVEGDVRQHAATIACHQEIAADGAFAVGMLAELEGPIRARGAWTYRRLFWETGAIGQVLYLGAEAEGLRGTGIGCFHDDLMHELVGIRDRSFQSLYHFTVGGHLEDPRIRTIASYHHRQP